ncbi:hypothetical protein Peur_062819 [Populus x canadensis]
MLGASAIVKITSVGRWSVIETLNQINQKTKSVEKTLSEYKCSPCSDPCECCEYSRETEACACGDQRATCVGPTTLEQSSISQNKTETKEISLDGS